MRARLLCTLLQCVRTSRLQLQLPTSTLSLAQSRACSLCCVSSVCSLVRLTSQFFALTRSGCSQLRQGPAPASAERRERKRHSLRSVTIRIPHNTLECQKTPATEPVRQPVSMPEPEPEPDRAHPPRACYNCRRRRLRCDRSRPSCHKCSTAGEECLGYGTVLRWANAPAVRGKLVGQLGVTSLKNARQSSPGSEGSIRVFVPPSLLDPLLSSLHRRARHYVHHCKQSSRSAKSHGSRDGGTALLTGAQLPRQFVES